MRVLNGGLVKSNRAVTVAREIGMAFLHPEKYVVAFELDAFLLTVALVAAVYIARRRREDFIQPEDQA